MAHGQDKQPADQPTNQPTNQQTLRFNRSSFRAARSASVSSWRVFGGRADARVSCACGRARFVCVRINRTSKQQRTPQQHGMLPHAIGPKQSPRPTHAEHRTAPHRTAPHRTAPHRTALTLRSRRRSSFCLRRSSRSPNLTLA